MALYLQIVYNMFKAHFWGKNLQRLEKTEEEETERRAAGEDGDRNKKNLL